MIEAMKYKKIYEQLKKDIEEAELKKEECMKNLSQLEKEIVMLDELIQPFARHFEGLKVNEALNVNEGSIQLGDNSSIFEMR